MRMLWKKKRTVGFLIVLVLTLITPSWTKIFDYIGKYTITAFNNDALDCGLLMPIMCDDGKIILVPVHGIEDSITSMFRIHRCLHSLNHSDVDTLLFESLYYPGYFIRRHHNKSTVDLEPYVKSIDFHWMELPSMGRAVLREASTIQLRCPYKGLFLAFGGMGAELRHYYSAFSFVIEPGYIPDDSIDEPVEPERGSKRRKSKKGKGVKARKRSVSVESDYCSSVQDLFYSKQRDHPSVPPPPEVLAVEGQTVNLSFTYQEYIYNDSVMTIWIVKSPNSRNDMEIKSGDPPKDGCSAALDNYSTFNCSVISSIKMGPLTLNQSGMKLKSVATLINDTVHHNSSLQTTIIVYQNPTISDSPGSAYRNITTGENTSFTCTYNASSDPKITVTMWSVNGTLLTHNTSQFTLITEHGIDYLDEVRSVLIISNATSHISGTYTCWCEYSASLIYRNEMFKSNPASVYLNVNAGTHSSQEKSLEMILIYLPLAAFGFLFTIFIVWLSLKLKNANSIQDHERDPLLNAGSGNNYSGAMLPARSNIQDTGETDSSSPAISDSSGEHYDRSQNVLD